MPLPDEFYRKLIHEAPVGLVLVDMKGMYIDFNTAYGEIIGYSLTDARKKSYWDLTPRKFKVVEDRLLQCIATLGEYGPFVKQYIHSTGKLVPVRLHLRRVTDGNGVSYIWSVVQHADDEELRLSLEMLKLIADVDDDSPIPRTR